MKICSVCNNKIDNTDALFCPHCGAKQKKEQRIKRKPDTRLQYLLFAVMMIVILALLIQNYRLTSKVDRFLSQQAAQTTPPHTLSPKQSTGNNPHSHNTMSTIASSMLCPCDGCENESLLTCSCTDCANKVKNRINIKIKKGWRFRAILEWFITQYGEQSLTNDARQVIRKLKKQKKK